MSIAWELSVILGGLHDLKSHNLIDSFWQQISFEQVGTLSQFATRGASSQIPLALLCKSELPGQHLGLQEVPGASGRRGPENLEKSCETKVETKSTSTIFQLVCRPFSTSFLLVSSFCGMLGPEGPEIAPLRGRPAPKSGDPMKSSQRLQRKTLWATPSTDYFFTIWASSREEFAVRNAPRGGQVHFAPAVAHLFVVRNF